MLEVHREIDSYAPYLTIRRQEMPAPFTIRLDDRILSELDRLATQTERSRNWLVSRAVEDFVALNKWQLEKIEAGIAAADRGEFASDEELSSVVEKFTPLR